MSLALAIKEEFCESNIQPLRGLPKAVHDLVECDQDFPSLSIDT